MSPFLTIVTRCCRRPVMLDRNINSVLEQTHQGIEQVFLVDHERQGVPWANRNLATAADRIAGEWVYILDDDTNLVTRTFVAQLRRFVARGAPDVVMVRSLRLQLEPCVLPTVWGNPRELRIGTSNCLCYVVQRDPWKEHIAAFGAPAAGDWHFLAALRNAGCSFGWLDVLAAKTQQLGRGVHFEDCPPSWFAQTARKFGIVDLDDGDLRLQLYERERRGKAHAQTPRGRAAKLRAERPHLSTPITSPGVPQVVLQPQPRPPAPHVLLSRRQRKV